MLNAKTSFLVTIATQRSGSKFLGTSLTAGQVAHSVFEAFQPGRDELGFNNYVTEFMSKRGRFGFGSGEIYDLLDGYIEKLTAVVAPRILHFDLMYNNLGGFSNVWTSPLSPPHENSFIALIKRRRAVVIHLVRDDLAEVFASHIIARESGVYHIGSEEGAPKLDSLTLRPAEAVDYALPILRTRRYVRAAFAEYPLYLECKYPSFIQGSTVSSDLSTRLAQMLSVDPTKIFGESKLKPTAPKKDYMISNYRDISELFLVLEKQLDNMRL